MVFIDEDLKERIYLSFNEDECRDILLILMLGNVVVHKETNKKYALAKNQKEFDIAKNMLLVKIAEVD